MPGNLGNVTTAAARDFTFQIVDLPCGPSADLSLIAASTMTVPFGRETVITLTAGNNGPDAVAAAVVTQTPPSGLVYVANSCGASFTAPTLTWNVGALAESGSATCYLTVRVDPVGGHSSTASISSEPVDTTPAT